VYLNRRNIEIRGGVVMYLGRIEKFAHFLVRPQVTIPEVCKFLVLETFSEYKSSALFATEITDDGYLTPVGSFGLNPKSIQSWGNIPLNQDLPFTEAVKTNSMLVVKPNEVFETFPALKNFTNISDDWDSHLICPVIPFGVFSLTLRSVPEVETEFELFVRTAFALAAFHFMRANVRIPAYSPKNKKIQGKRAGQLTLRQQMIKDLMQKGLTNAEIAEQIGYSESLVRHETMEIYAVLNISGRKELLDNSGGSS